jgi:dihydropteridine reductase
MARRALILGASGQLGRRLSAAFQQQQWVAIGADTRGGIPTPHAFVLNANRSLEDQSKALVDGLKSYLDDGSQLDAVVNVAGGFAMGSASDPAMLSATQSMIESSVYSSVMAAHVASSFLKPGGLLVLPGAAAALGPTAFSLPYGSAKAAVHQLVRSLADAEAAGLPAGTKTVGLAPQVLDTPQNREAMPDADSSTWATLDEVSSQLVDWSCDPTSLQSGFVYVVQKESGKSATFEAQPAL